MTEERINCRIDYRSQGDPKCRILVNGKILEEFVASGTHHIFSFVVSNGPFVLRFVHYGKDMKKQVDKFIEFEKIYFNDVDLKNIIWDTTQVPDLPIWQNKEDYEWKSNLYLGHNGYIEYKFRSPIIDYLLQHHTKGAKVSSNMGSYDMKLLYEMKEYFSKIVREQDGKSQ